MSSQTNEHAFETYVEEILLTRGGWKSGSNAEWDKERALFPAQVFAFIEATQPKLWTEMRTLHAAGLEALLLTTLVKELDAKGALHVLRHGFKFYGKLFRVAYFKPAHGANFDTIALFSKNRLTVTRQVPCHPADNRTLDMALAVNGLPVATIELKNPGTGQNWRHAVRQFRQDRDPRAPLFEFKKRALVHFAADSEEVHMPPVWLARRPISFRSTGGATPARSSVAPATRSTTPDTAPAISGRMCSSSRASSTSSATSCLSRRRMRRWTTAAAGSAS